MTTIQENDIIIEDEHGSYFIEDGKELLEKWITENVPYPVCEIEGVPDIDIAFMYHYLNDFIQQSNYQLQCLE